MKPKKKEKKRNNKNGCVWGRGTGGEIKGKRRKREIVRWRWWWYSGTFLKVL